MHHPRMRLVLGIGNPGSQYQDTRHNCGFLVLDEVARRHRLGGWSKRWSSLVASWPDAPGGDAAALIKPQTFVNLSGEAAQAALSFYKCPLDALLVVVDDLNLPLGTLRLRPGGSAGGHNGLRDIEARLGQGYHRLRLGIGQPHPGEQIDFVLGRFTPEEGTAVRAMLQRAADCVEAWCLGGIDAAAQFNGGSVPPGGRGQLPGAPPGASAGPTASPAGT
jgi:PTH1 family peptidyl-tRNA hydrolase